MNRPSTAIRTTALGAAAVLLSASGLVLAGGVQYDYAPVISVEPVYSTHSIPVDREVCWEETGYEPAGRDRPDSAAPTIVGAIIGGVVGNQFGGGNGKRAMTAAGAALGGSLAYDASRRKSGDHYPVTRERCTVQREYQQRSRTSGYRVQYEYRGEIYETRTNHPPGDVIRVRVAVTPAP